MSDLNLDSIKEVLKDYGYLREGDCNALITEIAELKAEVFNKTLTIEVCVAGAPPFISAVNGRATSTIIEEIETQLIDDELADGIYVFRIVYSSAQLGEYDMIEVPAYWEIDEVSFETLNDKEV